ncbi:MAG: HAD family hydrolase [Candidatus Dormibacteria bacterium]
MAQLVFLVDIDNTLLDNDRVKAAMEAGIRGLAGDEGAEQFWAVYEEVRKEFDYVDLPGTLARFRTLRPDLRKFPQMSAMLLNYPFEEDLYPAAMDVVRHLHSMGTVVVLSDGDPVFQPAKIGRIGVADAVDSNVLIYAHKERHLAEVQRLYPADHYVLIDDKPGVLSRAKRVMGARLTSVHVRQGKYATVDDPSDQLAPDVELAGIAEVLRLGPQDFANHRAG